jgi:hypothetical protein
MPRARAACDAFLIGTLQAFGIEWKKRFVHRLKR